MLLLAPLLGLLLASPLVAHSQLSTNRGFIRDCPTCDYSSAHRHQPAVHAEQRWFTNDVDHFAPATATYQQRYFVNTTFWSPGNPIFFYCGNEADVTGYVNVTGLMWENAPDFNAMVVFAEHRYYGQSQPPVDEDGRPVFLSHEQALADYVQLLQSLKSNMSALDVPVIAFGGSYGGMLAAWARIKYPAVFRGAIAGSAPIFAFFGSGNTFYDDGGASFWKVVTRDASPEGGSNAKCAPLVNKFFHTLFEQGKTPSGRDLIAKHLGLCHRVSNDGAAATVPDVARWVLNAFDNMAMGNYPFPSSYLTGNSDWELPSFPVRKACDLLVSAVERTNQPSVPQLFQGMFDAVGLFYNVSNAESCFTVDHNSRYDGIWDWQFCTEMLPEEFYFASRGDMVNDMFFPNNVPFSYEAIRDVCEKKWGVVPQKNRISEQYGSIAQLKASGVTNIVFSNGLLDPWSAGGLKESIGPSLPAIIIPNGAHHLDLMFSHPDDPEDVVEARKAELRYIRDWVGDE